MQNRTSRIACIDLSERQTRFIHPDPELTNNYLGGRGLGGGLLFADGPRISPLAEESSLYLMVGPLSGTQLPLSNRLCFVFRSPATHTIAWAMTGGYAAAALRYCGLEGVQIRGRAASPSTLVIRPEGIEITDASDLWGLGAIETCERLVAIYGDARVLSIGPAGEQLSPVATVINDKGRASGVRHGVGAVLGSKQLKAIVILGKQKAVVHPQDELAWRSLRQRVSEKLRASPVLNSKTGTMAVHGTGIAVEALGKWQSLPVRNYRETHLVDYLGLGGMTMSRTVLSERVTCSFCPVLCRRETASNGKFKFHSEGPDYAQLSSLGSNCALTDIEAVSYLNYLCYDLGFDPVEIGNTLAILAEATERGLVPAGLEWGDASAMIRLVQEAGVRDGIGELLFNGGAALARRLGVPDLAPAVKGITMQNCDPRPEPAWGLLNATETFGSAAHIWCYGDLVYGLREVGVQPLVNPGSSAREIACAVKHKQDMVAMLDSVGVCAFSSYAFSIDDYAEALRLIGIDMDTDRLLAHGAAIFALERRFNLENGFGPADDVLPQRFASEPVPSGLHAGKVCDLASHLKEYNALRGWPQAAPASMTMPS